MNLKRRGFFKTALVPFLPVVPITPTPEPEITNLPGVGELVMIDKSRNYFSFKDLKGLTKYLLDGKLHRDDGPAKIRPDVQEWYQNDILHRNDGPAIIYSDGTEFWYQNGLIHRDDGPAIIYSHGTKEWFQKGKRHRNNGPAVDDVLNKSKSWYQNGVLHRNDGPAMIDSNGNQFWYQNGKSHRTDGPAVLYSDGSEHWYQNGVTHRTDGPAVTYKGLSTSWYQNGFLHRTDGPALILETGKKEYYLNGRNFSFKIWEKRTSQLTSVTQIGHLLKNERILLGLSIPKFAEYLGVTKETYKILESNDQPLDLVQLEIRP